MALPYPSQPGEIDHMIADDHQVVERMFEHLESGHGSRRTLVDQVSFNLALHAFAEETVLYPALEEAGQAPDAEEARQEHMVMKEQLVLLDRYGPGEPEFEQALTSLMAAVRHHAPEEETRVLPAFRAMVGPDRLVELGAEFLAAKRRAPTRAHPHAPDEGGIEAVVGAMVAPVDKIRDMASGKKAGLATDASGALDPQAQNLLDAFSGLGPMPLEILEVGRARMQPTPRDAVMAAMEEMGMPPEPEPVGTIENITIPGPAGDVDARIYRPAAVDGGPLPVLVWVHGGGWVLYDIDTYDASCRGMTNKTGAIVVSLEYRHAPEAPFPAAHDDVLAGFRWVRDHATELGGDPTLVAIGGESVGGNMAAATSMQLVEAGEEPPACQVLVYPLTTGTQFGPSMDDAADARPLNRPLVSWMAMHAFTGNPDGARDPRVDLLGLSPDALAAMPPTLVITDERDPLRSQGEELAQHLIAAEVPTRAIRYEGVSHEFFGASAILDAAEEAQLAAAAFILGSFAGEVDVDLPPPGAASRVDVLAPV